MKILIALEVLMFDINLLNPPGIQGKSDLISTNKEENKRGENKFSEKNIKNNFDTTNKKVLIILSALLVLFITSYSLFKYDYFQLDKYFPNKMNFSFDIEEIIFELKNHNDNIIFNYMLFSDTDFAIEIETNNSDSFYSILDNLSNIVYDNVKGYRINNKFIVNLDIPWSINDVKSFDINLLSKELSDFSPDLKKEIYKEKLIIITDIVHLFNLLEFLYEVNVIRNFIIDIEPIESLPHTMKLYKIIVY